MPTYLRGFLPSLGAGGSLVGASLVVAAILSSVIAFQGWPGATAGGDGGSVTLQDRAAPAVAKPVQATPATSAARVEGATPAQARRRGATRRTTAPGPTPRRRGSAPAAPQTGGSAPVQSPASPASPSPRGTEPAPTRSTPPAQHPSQPTPASPVPDRPVTTVVDTVQNAVPPLPQPVQPVVDTVNQVADGAAMTVDDTVGGLLP
jgi:hypothetical protein